MNQSLTLRVGDLELKAVGRTASFRGDHVELTPRRFDLLATMMREPERAFTAAELMKHVWPNSRDESVVRMTIRRLRSEFLNPEFLVNREGGYAVTADCPQEIVEEVTLGPWNTRASMRSSLKLKGKITRPITVVFPATLNQAEHERWIRAIASALATRHCVNNPRHIIATAERRLDIRRGTGVAVRATVARQGVLREAA